MNEIQQETAATLHWMAGCMSRIPVLSELSNEVEKLAWEVDKPCVVAVVGRVKAGKSTFINALLGEDLAKVGVTETTATINKFRYGNPHPKRPVRCHWRGGEVTNEDREFLDGLQGYDFETLRRADGIECLEYLLPNPRLKQTTLVDTPGTNAAADKHQNRTAEYLQLYGQLRDRHNQETQRIGGEADAVIYLIGAVARATDRDLLEEFSSATARQSQLLNTIGVIAKIDLQPEILNRRDELSKKIAWQLKDSLNTVVPVSAGIHRAADILGKGNQADLRQLIEAVRRIPPDTLEEMLTSDGFFLEEDYPDCPVTKAERQNLYDGDWWKKSWTVFSTIARIAADRALSQGAVLERIGEVSGFGPLNEILQEHFFDRGRLLRCFRIVNDASKLLGRIKRDHEPALRKRKREEQARLDRFLSFIQQSGGDRAVAKELEAFLTERHESSMLDEVEKFRADSDEKLSDLQSELEGYNADFEALQQIEKHKELFPIEIEELRSLLGRYGTDIDKRLDPGKASSEYVSKQQLAWRRVESQDASAIRRLVAERVQARYGSILTTLEEATRE